MDSETAHQLPVIDTAHTPPTIYDVARSAGVSIASVSRVLNGRRNPLPDTRERVMQAVAELGFIPDGAARALSARLKEIVGVVIRRPTTPVSDDGTFEDEEESLQFPDLINRGIEVAAQRRDYNLLVSSVGRGRPRLQPGGSSRWPARATGSSCTTRCSTRAKWSGWPGTFRSSPWPAARPGHRERGRGQPDRDARTGPAPDPRPRLPHAGLPRRARGQPGQPRPARGLRGRDGHGGREFLNGRQWQGNYSAAGGARVIDRPAGQRGHPAPGDRLRERPDRARRGLRADPPRRRRARRRRRHRLRRHPRGPAPAPAAHHRPAADPGTRRDRVRGPSTP